MFLRFLVVIFSLGAAGVQTTAETAPAAFILKRLIIADTDVKAATVSVEAEPDKALFVQDVPVLADAGFAAKVQLFIGKQITNELVNALAGAIAQHARERDRLIVKVIPPTQDVSGGTLRLAVVIGRYNQVEFRGNRWFSSKLLEAKLGIKAGDEVVLSTLDNAVNWANTNPFRQIKVLINDLEQQPGKADLIVGVEERIPVRFTASFDDTGNSVLGKRHYTGSVQFGNLWGRDHQGSYQLTTSDHPSVFQSHSVDYRLPLPWRHNLQFSGGFLKVKPTFGAGGVFTQKGQNILANLRYTASLGQALNPLELAIGVDFKQGNNNLAYGGTTLISNTTDTFQLTTALSRVRRDRRGAWVFGLGVDLSPGRVNSRNTDAAYSIARFNTKATYATATLSVQRLLNLEKDWSVFSRAFFKLATANLPGSEQLSIGGSSTVRGFDERINSGDQGFVFSNDLQLPQLRYGTRWLGKGRPIDTRLIAFYDAAQVFYRHRDLNDVKFTPLASTGIGLRMNVASNFTLSADYGWQITRLNYPPPTKSRGHLKVVLAF